MDHLMVYGLLCFSYIVAISFIDGGNRRKTQTCDKSL